MPWSDWIRTVEVEPSLYAADFARLGEQVERCCAPACASSTSTSATATSSSRSRSGRSCCGRSRRSCTRLGGVARLPPDGRRTPRTTSRRSPRRAATASPSTSRPSTTSRATIARGARARAAGRASRSSRRPSPAAVAAVARGRGHRPLHEHRARLLGPGVHAGGARPDPRAARAAAAGGARSRSTAASATRTSARCATRARRCSSPARRSSAREDLPRAYRRLVQALRVSLERALELAERGRGKVRDHPLVGAVVVARRRGRGGGLVRVATAVAHAEVDRARAGGRAGARRDAVRDARAVRAPRPDAAVRRRGARGGRRARRRRLARPEPEGGRRASSGCAPPGVEVELVDSLRRRGGRTRPGGRGSRCGRPFVTYKAAVTLDGRVTRARRALGHGRGDAPARARAAGGGRRGRRRHGHRRAPTGRG